MAFELLDHEADLGLEIEAGTLEELFAEAVRGLAACLTDVSGLRARDLRRRVEVTGRDSAELLVRWLKEWLYLHETERFLAAEVRMIELSGTRAVGEGVGELRDPVLHPAIREIKGVTYHQAAVERRGNLWCARVIFDV
jgi:SHS2 domain-containing protein